MDRATAAQRLATLNHKDHKDVNAFIRQLTDESLEAPRAMVELWRTKPSSLPIERPLLLIPDLEELAIRPLLEIPPEKLAPTDEAWLMRTTTAAVNKLRNMLVLRLIKLLGNSTPMPLATIPGSEEQPAPRRVCDEAYMALRELLCPEDNLAAHARANYGYLNMQDQARDVEIRKFKTTKAFIRFAD